MRQLAFPMIAAATLAACSAAPVAHAEGGAPARTMTVTGNGEASGAPDIAVMSIGVETEAATAKAAL